MTDKIDIKKLGEELMPGSVWEVDDSISFVALAPPGVKYKVLIKNEYFTSLRILFITKQLSNNKNELIQMIKRLHKEVVEKIEKRKRELDS